MCMRIGAFLRRVNAKIANFFSKATSKGVPKRSLCISLVVGSLLTLINQGNLLIGGMWPSIWKVGLTYFVPYCVSTYGAVLAMLANEKIKANEPPVTSLEPPLMSDSYILDTPTLKQKLNYAPVESPCFQKGYTISPLIPPSRSLSWGL